MPRERNAHEESQSATGENSPRLADEAGDSHDVAALIHTALYDNGGESVEGAFADGWETYSYRAITRLETIFGDRGFTADDALRIREVMHEPSAPSSAVVELVAHLGRHTRPLVQEMRHDPLPRARELAVLAGAELFSPQFWLDALTDPAPEVRTAAVRTLAAHWKIVPDNETLLTDALNDEHESVRLAAKSVVTFYAHPGIAQALIRHLERETDASRQETIIRAIAEATRRHLARDTQGAFATGVKGPAKALLLHELNNADAEIRKLMVETLHHLPDAEVATALIEQLIIETDRHVRSSLLRFPGYSPARDRALPVLSTIRDSESDLALRALARRLIENLSALTTPAPIAVMDDPVRPRVDERHRSRTPAIQVLPFSLQKLRSVLPSPKMPAENCPVCQAIGNGGSRLIKGGTLEYDTIPAAVQHLKYFMRLGEQVDTNWLNICPLCDRLYFCEESSEFLIPDSEDYESYAPISPEAVLKLSAVSRANATGKGEVHAHDDGTWCIIHDAKERPCQR